MESARYISDNVVMYGKGPVLSIDSARRALSNKESKLASLQKSLAAKHSKLAAASKKANSAREAASKTRSDTTRRTKLRLYESAMRDVAKLQKDVSMLQKQIVSAEKGVKSAKDALAKEEKRASVKEGRAAERASRELDQRFDAIDSSIGLHESRIEVLESKPSSVTVLYLGTSPEDAERLRLDAEARDIREAIRLSDNPDAIVFEDRWAVRQNDLLQALNETNPDIVHFSGHGAQDGSLAIEDLTGKALLISKDAMASVIESAAKKVRLVVFNACFSDEQAEKVLEHVDAAIGMTTSISDAAAVAFARQLYSSIGFGHSLATAFNQARAAVAIAAPDEKGTPKLHTRAGLEASQIVFVGR